MLIFTKDILKEEEVKLVERDNKNYKLGITCALGCGVIWGLLPIYWQALQPIDSAAIIFYRIALMAVVCFLACVYKYGIKNVFKPMVESKKKFFTYVAAGIVITINWSIYIWAVNAGFVIQTCMGYFLEPLVVCIFGIIIYKEKANNWKRVSIVFAVIGLLIMIIGYGQMPVIAVGLGLSFATYSAIKKSVFISPIQSLLYETIVLTPIALIVIIYLEKTGAGALAVGSTSKFILLLFAGIATALPMGLFSFAANKLPLITIGLTEYISPSIALILGIFFFKEPFDAIQFSAFVVIWIGLVFFTYGEIKDGRQALSENSGKQEN